MNYFQNICPCCGKQCNEDRVALRALTKYNCELCGFFIIPDSLKSELLKRKSMIFYYLLHKKPFNNKSNLFVSDINSCDKKDDYNYVDLKMLDNLYPQTLDEMVDMLLLNLSTYIKKFGDIINILYTEDNPIYFHSLFLINNELEDIQSQIVPILSILLELDYVKIVDDNGVVYTFTANGWKRVFELQKKKGLIPKAFIAMAFNDDMKFSREKIMQAIKESGYIPMIIDEKQHNNQIVPEIFYEIETSMFVIVDLTYHRNGVYYEAGYAQALKKEVIIPCKACDFDKRHFDIAQKNIIKWIDEDDLYNRLIERINATIGKRDI